MRVLWTKGTLLAAFLVVSGLAACSGGSSSETDTITADTADVQAEVTGCVSDDECVSDDVCMQGSCGLDGACVYAPKTGTCDDDNLCTENDQCNTQGVCVGTAKACDDGLFCNGAETCNAETGNCDSSAAPELSDGIDCTLDECDEDEDSIVHTPQNTECDDGNLCTEDLCDSVAGCQNNALVDELCDDGDLCTEDDACNADGQCEGAPKLCSDGLFCNGTESCDAETGDCVSADVPVVDDGVPCTVDVCDEDLDQVTHTADDAACNDSNDCTTDTCDLATGCGHADLTGVACEDGDACTGGDTCQAGVCVAGSIWLCDEICDNDIDDDQDGSTDCEDTDCYGDAVCPPGSGDDCSGPIVALANPVSAASLPLETTLLGATTAMADDFGGTCSPAGASDVVYFFELTDPAVLTALLTPSSASTAGLTLVKDSCVAGMPLICEMAPAPEMTVGLSAGYYYLFVDMAPGDFTLGLSFAAPAANETSCDDLIDEDADGMMDCFDDDCYTSAACLGKRCESADPINDGVALGSDFVGAAALELTGTTAGSGMDYTLSCEPMSEESEDYVYRLELTETMALNFEYSLDGGYDYPAMAIMTGTCDDWQTVTCMSPRTAAALTMTTTLTAGTYFLVLDAGYPGDGGEFTLAISAEAAPATETVCYDGVDDDVDGNVDCLDDDCALDPYCLDPYEINDSLELAYDLGDITDGGFMTDDGASIYPLGDRDVFSAFLQGPGFVTIDVEPALDATDLDVMVFVYDGDGVHIATIDDVWEPGAETATYTYEEGTYYIEVAGYESTGAYTLTIMVDLADETETDCGDGIDNDLDGLLDCNDTDCGTEPSCEGEACGFPYLLNEGNVVTAADDGLVLETVGDNTSKGLDFESTCETGSADSPDLVYALTLEAGFMAHITYVFDDSWDYPALSIFSGSCDMENEIFCDSTSGDAIEANVPLLAGTYYFVADGADGYSEGPFSLTISLALLDETETDCADGVDNDGNGDVDCCDTACAEDTACAAELMCLDGADNDCDGFVDCMDPDCGSEPACKGEACNIPLYLYENSISKADDGLEVHVEGDTTNASNDYALACEGSTGVGLDQVYVMELTDPMLVTIAHDFTETYNYPAVFLMQGACAAEDLVACDKAGSEGPATISGVALAAGTYFIIVDSTYSSDYGPYTLDVSFITLDATETNCSDGLDNDADGFVDCCDSECALENACAAELLCGDGIDNDCDGAEDCGDMDCAAEDECAGETCATAYLLADGADISAANAGTFDVAGDTTGAAKDYDFTCVREDANSAAGVGPDLVYSFTLTETMMAHFEMDFTDSGNGPGLYLTQGGCLEENLLACDWTESEGGPAVLPDMELTAGTYYLIVDSVYSSDDGPFNLSASFFIVTDTETVCNDGIDNDGDTLTDCCDDECAMDAACLAETLCGDGEDNDCDTLVDCEDSDCLDVFECQGDVCETPKKVNGGVGITVADDGLVLDYTGDTRDWTDDYQLGCDVEEGLAKDEVYQFVLTDPMIVSVTYDFTNNYYYPLISLVEGACGEWTSLACDYSTSTVPGASTSIDGLGLSAGTYYLVLDGAGTFEANVYTLHLEFLAPQASETNCGDGVDNDGDTFVDCCDTDCSADDACLAETLCGDGEDNDCDGAVDCDDMDCSALAECEGENCATAKALVDHQISTADDGQLFTVTGDTTGMSGDLGGSCSAPSASASDEVWTFTVAETVRVTATMDFDGTYTYPAVYLFQGACETADELACGKATSTPATFTAVLEPGLYYLVADANYAGDEDIYSLSLAVEALSLTETDCTDGTDNDGDGFTDCCDDECDADAACLTETDCADGIDNDCNGLADCADAACSSLASCEGEICETALALTDHDLSSADDGLTLNLTGDTSTKAADYAGSCDTDTAAARDEAWTFTVAEPVLISVAMDFDATLNYPAVYLLSGACDSGTELACSSATSTPAQFETLLDPGTYYIIADAGYSSDDGPYTLTVLVSAAPTSETDCSDGIDNDGDTFIDCCDEDCAADLACLAEIDCSDGIDNDCDTLFDCDDDDCSADAACMVFALPFSEDVENGGQAPEGWISLGPTGCDWTIDSTGADGTGYSVKKGYSSNCLDAESAFLASPTLDLSACNTVNVLFWEKGQYQIDRIYHGVGITDGTTTVEVELGDAPTTFTQLEAPIVLDVSGIDTGRFFFAYAGYYADNWWVDQLEITCADTGAPVLPVAGDLIITEILQNPNGDDAPAEWVEFLVLADHDLNLEGCILKDDGSDAHTIDAAGAGVVVTAGTRFVLASGDSAVNGGIEPAYVFSGFYLGNSDDEVILVCDGTEICRVNYDDGLATFPADMSGVSMQLDAGSHTAALYADGTNWCLSTKSFSETLIGTPNLENTVCDASGPEVSCTDGLDDDNDGLTDCCDPACSLDAACVAETACDDLADNDCDGMADCEDLDCAYDVGCFVDADMDGIPDGLDVCNLGDDNVDADANTQPDACQIGWVGSAWPNTGASGDTNDDFNVYVQVWMEGRTDIAGAAPGITAKVFYKMEDDPTYVEAVMSFNADTGNNDEFTYSIPSFFTESGKNLLVDFEVTYTSVEGVSTDYPFLGVIQDQSSSDAPFSYSITGSSTTPVNPAVAGDVLITEIMYDPPNPPDDNPGEWIEIYNPTATDFNLEGCSIADGAGSHVISTGGAGLLLAAGSYMVMGRNADTSTNGGVTEGYVYVATPTTSAIQLGNSGDQVYFSCNGTAIDSVDYDALGFADPVGASLQLDPASYDSAANDDGANWCASTNQWGATLALGTPGAVNATCE